MLDTSIVSVFTLNEIIDFTWIQCFFFFCAILSFSMYICLFFFLLKYFYLFILWFQCVVFMFGQFVLDVILIKVELFSGERRPFEHWTLEGNHRRGRVESLSFHFGRICIISIGTAEIMIYNCIFVVLNAVLCSQ